MTGERRTPTAGHALITVLGLLAVLFPLAAFAVREAYVDVLLGRHTQMATELFYAAEAGLAHALADLAADPTFERLAAGPDGIVDTPDDDVFPFHSPPPSVFPRAPFRYEAVIGARTATSLEIRSLAVGPNNATHRVAAAIRRAPVALAPGPVAISATSISFAVGSDVQVSGFDAAGEKAPHAAITLEDSQLAHDLAQQLGPAGGQLVGAGGSPSLAVEPIRSPVEHAATAADLPEAQYIGPTVSGPLGSGCLVRSGSLDVTAAEGSGLLIVKGHLRVAEHFSFVGLIVVEGDVEFAAESTVEIRGGIWQGPTGERWGLLGAGTLVYDSDVMQALDTAFPTLFLHRALVTGWRDLF